MCCLAVTPGGWMNGLSALSLSPPKVTSLAGVPGCDQAGRGGSGAGDECAGGEPRLLPRSGGYGAGGAESLLFLSCRVVRWGDARNPAPCPASGKHLRSGTECASDPCIAMTAALGPGAEWRDGPPHHRRAGRTRGHPAAAVRRARARCRRENPPWSSSRARPASARPAWSPSSWRAQTPPTLAGACVPVAGEPLPYAALTQALRRTGGSGVVRQETLRSPELARLLPQGDGRRPARTRPGARAPGRVLAAAAVPGRARAARRGWAPQGPVLHVVEDVHWADRSTLDLLAFLATNLTDERVLLLLTYRRGRPRRVPHPRAVAGRAGPAAPRTGSRCPRLDRADAVRLVTELAGGTLPPERLEETLDALGREPAFRRAAGPRRATSPGRSRPRCTSCSGPGSTTCRATPARLLRAAAVIGRVASVPLLARTVGADEEDVEDRLRVAIAAHVAEVRRRRQRRLPPPRVPRGRVRRAAAGGAGAAAPGRRRGADRARPARRPRSPARWPGTGTWPATCERALEASVAGGPGLRADVRVRRRPRPASPGPRAAGAGAVRRRPGRPGHPRRGRGAAWPATARPPCGSLEAALADGRRAAGRAALLERLGSVHFVAGDAGRARTAFRQRMELLPDGRREHAGRPGVRRVRAAGGRLVLARRAPRRPAPTRCGSPARSAPGARRARRSTRSGIVAATRGDARRGRRAAPRVAGDRPRGRRARTTSGSPTSTSATCSASPAGWTRGSRCATRGSAS